MTEYHLSKLIKQQFNPSFLVIYLHSGQGVSINTFDLQNVMYPLIYGGDAANTTGGFTNASSR